MATTTAPTVTYMTGPGTAHPTYLGPDRDECVRAALGLRAVHGDSRVCVAVRVGDVYDPDATASLMGDVLRPRVARVPAQRRSRVAGCVSCVEGAAPHDAAAHCLSGGRVHCSCDGACY